MAMTEQQPMQATLKVLHEHAIAVNLKLIEHDERFDRLEERMDRLEAKLDAIIAHFGIEQPERPSHA